MESREKHEEITNGSMMMDGDLALKGAESPLHGSSAEYIESKQVRIALQDE